MKTLTNADLRRVIEVGQLLMTPADAPTLSTWRAQAHQAVAKLIDSDRAAFVLPMVDEPFIICEDDLRQAGVEWEREFQYRDPGYITTRSERKLTVFHHSDVYDMARYVHSDEYHEWVRPHRLFESFAMSVDVAHSPVPASINCYRSDTRRPFGARERTILELLYPSFRAGVDTVLRGLAGRTAIRACLDGSTADAVLLDEDGRVHHETPGATRLLDLVGREAITATLGALVRRTLDPSVSTPVSAVHRVRRPPTIEQALGGATTIRVLDRTLVLQPSILPASPGWRGRLVLVVLAGGDAPVSDDQLRSQFGLTARELVVARALETPAEVTALAEQLGISLNTFRRHTEKVFRKLAVTSRKALVARLSRPA